MRCLNPISLKNPKYKLINFVKETVDNDGVVHEHIDDSQLLVPCGKCAACLKTKRNQLCFRLWQEYLTSNSAYFITLTISDQFMHLFEDDPKRELRKWFESVRYKFGTSPRHFIVSELGESTHRLHFHGIIYDPVMTEEELSKTWPYGFSYVGWVSASTISYVTKYITKPQVIKFGYKPFTLQSNRPGLGVGYLDDPSLKQMILDNGPFCYMDKRCIPIPRYYMEKIFTDDERRSMAVKYQLSLEKNPTDYMEKAFKQFKVSTVEEYLSKVQSKYLYSIFIGNSKKFKHGTFTKLKDSSTSERIEF